MGKYIYNIARASTSELRTTLITMRKESRTTQEDVAKCAGITQSAVSKYERGEVEGTSLDLVRAYCNATGAGIEAMIFYPAHGEKEQTNG